MDRNSPNRPMNPVSPRLFDEEDEQGLQSGFNRRREHLSNRSQKTLKRECQHTLANSEEKIVKMQIINVLPRHQTAAWEAKLSMFEYGSFETDEYKFPAQRQLVSRPGRSLRKANEPLGIVPARPKKRIGGQGQSYTMMQTKINLGGEDWFYGEELLKTLKTGEDAYRVLCTTKIQHPYKICISESCCYAKREIPSIRLSRGTPVKSIHERTLHNVGRKYIHSQEGFTDGGHTDGNVDT